MFVFFRCIAEAVVENGLKGLADMVPGGKFACEVAECAWRKYRERKLPANQREEIQQILEVSFDEARHQALEAAHSAVAGHSPTAEELVTLELYLSAIPEALRQSLKRAEDPTGTTVPANFHLGSGDDVVKLLPARPPRFRVGMELPGKSGWVLNRLLGIGGFGEVWLTQHARMKSLSGAVKFCFGQSGQDLIHEADLIDRVMSAGKHPNIVPLVDAHLDGNTPWLLFEYISGGNLTDWIHRLAGMPREQRRDSTLSTLRQLAGAVDFFHQQTPPIVHRDLKPSNILLDRGNVLHITDFGIGAVTAREALRQESHGQSTRGGRLLTYLRGSHTPIYASSQQRDGHDPDPRDDVHALGVIGYQLLTGHLAQGAGPDFADDLRDVGANEELIALLGRCVAQKVERRPKNAREVLQHLAGMGETKSAQVPTKVPELVPSTLIDAKAIYEEGEKYYSARGVPQDYARAAQLFLESANQNYAAAQNYLGFMYMNGHGVRQDDARAVELYRKAADQNYAAALANLGFMHQYGRGVKQDDVRAVEFYRKAADQGYKVAQYSLGSMYMDGRGVKQDDFTAVELFRKSMEQGYANAQSNLGFMYQHGRGVKQDLAKAVELYRKAADQGYSAGQYNLGSMYMDGRGVQQDDVVAVELFRKAADQGYANAQSNLGFMYQHGRGVKQDYARAVDLYRKAADQGNDGAQYNLGFMYMNGRHVKQDDAVAVELFRKSADQGYANAQSNLGFMYMSGRGVKQDDAMAVDLYRKAADQGNAGAQFNLGFMYQHGRGVKQDDARAVELFRLAAARGQTNAIQELARRGLR